MHTCALHKLAIRGAVRTSFTIVKSAKMKKNNETPAENKVSDETATESADPVPPADQESSPPPAQADKQQPKEYGGPKGLEPTRYGDWERNGRCYDF